MTFKINKMFLMFKKRKLNNKQLDMVILTFI